MYTNGAKSFFILNNGRHLPKFFVGTDVVSSYESARFFITQCLHYKHRSFEFHDDNILAALALTNNLPRYDLVRENVFITLKLKISAGTLHELLYYLVKDTLATFLQVSGIQYVDVLIIHIDNDSYRIQRAVWNTIQELVRTDEVDNIGLSNSTLNCLADVLTDAPSPPILNQIVYNPLHQRKGLIELCRSNGIQVQGYNLFGDPSSNELLQHPAVQAIAMEHDATPDQVLVLWAIKNGVSVLVNTDNGQLLDDCGHLNFSLTLENMNLLNNLE